MQTVRQIKLIEPYPDGDISERWMQAQRWLLDHYDFDAGIIENVRYDTKSDRYVAMFRQGQRTNTIKLSMDVAKFLLAHMGENQQALQNWLTLDELGAAVDCLRVLL